MKKDWICRVIPGFAQKGAICENANICLDWFHASSIIAGCKEGGGIFCKKILSRYSAQPISQPFASNPAFYRNLQTELYGLRKVRIYTAAASQCGILRKRRGINEKGTGLMEEAWEQ